jgi:hypothetical protein
MPTPTFESEGDRADPDEDTVAIGDTELGRDSHARDCLDALAAALCAIGADVQVVTTLADLPEAVRRSAAPGDVVLLSLREQFASSVDMIEEALGADRARARPTRISTP